MNQSVSSREYDFGLSIVVYNLTGLLSFGERQSTILVHILFDNYLGHHSIHYGPRQPLLCFLEKHVYELGAS